MSRIARLGVLGALLFVLGACQVRTEIEVRVDADGSGSVVVAVGLDEDAIERSGDPAELFVVEDLVAAGWTVADPVAGDDGFTWIRATKSFGSTDEAAAVLGEVTGDSRVLDQVALSRTDSFTTTAYAFEAIADLSGGLAAFSDADLTAALDGEPLGESIPAIEARFGAPVDELFSVVIRVDLPGDVVEPTAGGATEWTPAVGDGPLVITAGSEIRDRTPLVWAGVAGVAAAGSTALAAWRLTQRRRFRRARHASPST